MSDTVLDLASGRRGHFLLESGYHGRLWLDLNPLFVDPRQIDPFVSRLAERLRPYSVDVACGALMGGAFLAQLVARTLHVDFCFTEHISSPRGGGLFGARYHLPRALADRFVGNALPYWTM